MYVVLTAFSNCLIKPYMTIIKLKIRIAKINTQKNVT